MKSWKKYHPDWEYMLWTEKNIPKLVNQEAFDTSPNWHQKSDILRYEILFRYGGIYIDSDEYCLKSIEPLLEQTSNAGFTLIAGREGSEEMPNLVANGVLGCLAGEPFMQKMIENINVNQPAKKTWEKTGPLYLTDMIEKFRPSIHVVAAKVFYPIHHRGVTGFRASLRDFRDDKEVFGVQMWGSTYNLYKPKWYKQPVDLLRYYYHLYKGKQISRIKV